MGPVNPLLSRRRVWRFGKLAHEAGIVLPMRELPMKMISVRVEEGMSTSGSPPVSEVQPMTLMDSKAGRLGQVDAMEPVRPTSATVMVVKSEDEGVVGPGRPPVMRGKLERESCEMRESMSA